MENFNRIISFVLGLVVVIVFIAVITGKLNIGSKVKTLGTKKITITPSPTVIMQPEEEVTAATTVNNNYSAKTPTTIPSTGSPTILLPIIFSSLTVGLFLHQATKKD